MRRSSQSRNGKAWLFAVILAAGLSVLPAAAALEALNLAPPAGSGYNALQGGGALPAGASSLYYNPALLSELERATGSRFHVTYSSGEPYPPGTGARQRFAGFAMVLPGPGRNLDFGVGFFRNALDWGKVLAASDSGEEMAFDEPYENVYGLGAAVSFLGAGVPVSLGGTIKLYDSHLGEGIASSGNHVDMGITGWAFDAGILVRPVFLPAKWLGVESVEFSPSVGLTLQNIGPDARYEYAEESYPRSLPVVVRSSLGAQIRIVDAVEISGGEDWDGGTEKVADFSGTLGFSVAVLGARYSRALKFGTYDEREIHQALAYELSLLQVHRLKRRFLGRDFHSASRTLDTGFRFSEAKFLGIPYRLNPGFSAGRRWISTGSRADQDAWYLSLSL